jgi:multiple sugar transport system ATP-binding protein
MATVVLEHVRKSYPGPGNRPVDAVKDFSCSIADGEFVVLVGPSGCGKSTTLRMVAGLEDVTAGTIAIGGRVVNGVAPKDRDIAMVFQSYALYPHMSVYANMAFALKLRGVPRAEIDRRVRDAARILGIEDLLDRKPKQLSGGQKQRVAVGRCIVREPKAFLFDEPLSNLDAKLRVTTRAELKALHHRLKTTTVYVTHDQEEAMTLGDRIVVMSKGLIQQAAPPLEVYRRPVNRFVAGFIGTPPMNFLPGRVTAEGGLTLRFEAPGAGGLAIPAAQGGRFAAHAGKPAVLGVRPQAFHEARAGAAEGTIRVRVRVVEPLGDSIDVHATLEAAGAGAAEGPMLVARLPAREGLVAGQGLDLAVDLHSCHLFEPGEFGANLTLDAAVRA